MANPDEKDYKSYSYILFMVLNAAIGGAVLFGYSLGVFNSVQDLLALDLDWGDKKSIYIGMTTAFMPLGCMFGALFSEQLSNKFGRRGSFIILDILCLIGTAIGLIASIWTFLIWRLIVGFSVGASSVLVPLYISEMSPKSIRGKLGSYFQFSVNVGILVAFLLAWPLPSEENYEASSSLMKNYWRFLFAFPVLVSIFRFVNLLLFFKHDTPRSYLTRTTPNVEACHEIMGIIYKDDYVEELTSELMNDIKNTQKSTYTELFTPAYRPRLTLALCVNIIQQLCGINAIIFYSNNIFKSNTDSSKESPDERDKIDLESKIFTLGVAVILGVGAYVSGLISDKAGRKKLLLLGEIFSVIFLGMISILLYAGITVASPYLILAFLFSFGVSLGPVVWFYVPEIVNSKGCSLAGLVNWFCAFILGLVFIPLKDAISLQGVFLIFCGISLAGFVYTWFFVEETKNKTKEEIDRMFPPLFGAGVKETLV